VCPPTKGEYLEKARRSGLQDWQSGNKPLEKKTGE